MTTNSNHPAIPAGEQDNLNKRLFEAAIRDLAAISEHLGLDPEDGGAEPIIDAINALRRERDQWVDAQYAVAGEQDERAAFDIIADALLPYVRGSQNAATLAHAVIDALAAAPAASSPGGAQDAAEKPPARLTDSEQVELLDWVSACQSAYHIENTPAHRFGGLSGALEENRTALVEFVDALIAARMAAPAAGDARDAARYRFIRDVPYTDEVRSVMSLQQNAIMDASIDAAIAAQQGEGEATNG